MTVAPLLLGVSGLRLTADEKALLRMRPPFSIVLFGRNIDTPEQLRALIDDIDEATDGRALVSIDQEGGRVQRLAPPHWPAYPTPLAIGASDDAEARIDSYYRLILDDLRRLGIRMNYAPCLDIAHEDTHPFLRNRCLGEDAGTVVRLGRRVLKTHLENGVVPVIKHMPGHGPASVDSHKSAPVVSYPEWRPDRDLPADMDVFRHFTDTHFGMTAHLIIPEIDPETPLTLSPRGITFLREYLMGDGALMSDDLGMGALSGTPYDRVAGAFDVGLDLALFCSGKFEDNKAILSRDWPLSDRAALKIKTAQEIADRDIAPLDDNTRRALRDHVFRGFDETDREVVPLGMAVSS